MRSFSFSLVQIKKVYNIDNNMKNDKIELYEKVQVNNKILASKHSTFLCSKR